MLDIVDLFWATFVMILIICVVVGDTRVKLRRLENRLSEVEQKGQAEH